MSVDSLDTMQPTVPTGEVTTTTGTVVVGVVAEATGTAETTKEETPLHHPTTVMPEMVNLSQG